MSGSELAAVLIAELIGGVVGALVGCPLGAMLLKVASKWVAGLNVPFGKAFWTVFTSFYVNFVLLLILTFAVVGETASMEAVRALHMILVPVGFLIQSGIISSQLEFSFGKACLVSITMIGMFLGIALVVALIIFSLMQATGSL